ncbi:hypothetical protein ACFPM0_08595 [Pseudonocardia sulfidoxydans]|uniref:hypothetical protein n=1 Tax=Pseudonocardia sulfidoxydans TaxID=54011 RepID=UPI0036060A76
MRPWSASTSRSFPPSSATPPAAGDLIARTDRNGPASHGGAVPVPGLSLERVDLLCLRRTVPAVTVRHDVVVHLRLAEGRATTECDPGPVDGPTYR